MKCSFNEQFNKGKEEKVERVIDDSCGLTKGRGKRGHIVADTLLPTQMFPRLPARATCVADTNFVSLFRNILCLQQMFPSLRSPKTSWATMCPQQCVLVCQGL